MSPVTNLLSGLLGVVTNVVGSVLGLVGSLVTGVVNVLQSLTSSVQINLVLIPQVDKMVNGIDQRIDVLLYDYENGDFVHSAFVFNRDVLREQAKLKSGTVPASAVQAEQKAVNDLQARYNQIIATYNQLFVVPSNCSAAPSCGNTAIQVADCSCYSSPNVTSFLNDYNNIFVPLKKQDLAFFKSKIAQDYTAEVENPQTVQSFATIRADAQTVYVYVYQNVGNEDDSKIGSYTGALSAAINALAASYPEGIDTASYTGEF